MYLITEEWYEGEAYNVTAYGQKTTEQIDDITNQMEKYSPYDYCDYCELKTPEEYEHKLDVLKGLGSVIKFAND